MVGVTVGPAPGPGGMTTFEVEGGPEVGPAAATAPVPNMPPTITRQAAVLAARRTTLARTRREMEVPTTFPRPARPYWRLSAIATSTAPRRTEPASRSAVQKTQTSGGADLQASQL